MRRLWKAIAAFWDPEDSSLAGYAVLLAIVALLVVVALIFLSPMASQIYEDTGCLQCTSP